MENKDKNAFPCKPHTVTGLTKREYIATAAMQGYISADKDFDTGSIEKAKWAVEDADALLKALEQELSNE
jgi:hypothetical protein